MQDPGRRQARAQVCGSPPPTGDARTEFLAPVSSLGPVGGSSLCLCFSASLKSTAPPQLQSVPKVDNVAVRRWRNRYSFVCLLGGQTGTTTQKAVWQYHSSLSHTLTYQHLVPTVYLTSLLMPDYKAFTWVLLKAHGKWNTKISLGTGVGPSA